jgi:[acyl-carrier-protein] S-malonyltransferase
MNIALLFPGQGSQSVGMLASLAADNPEVADVMRRASGVLGYDLWELISHGPEERLNSTECTQPAMLAAAVATFRAWRARGGAAPQFVAGHSLGEFSALVAAQVLELETAIDLVRFRGQAMQEAVPAGAGAVAAILGLDDAAVAAACADAAQGEVVEAVNFNAPAQVVIAGDAAAVGRAIDVLKTRGAKRALLLPVSVPVHSSLMRPAAERMRSRLAGVVLRAPRCEFVSSVDAATHSDPEDIRELLVRQLASPVRWVDTVRALVARGADRLVECGPGKVLTGLTRRIDKRPEIVAFALEDQATLAAALQGAAAQVAGP